MPAQSSGAASSSSMPSGMRSAKSSLDHDVGRVAAGGRLAVAADAAVGADVAVEAVLLQALLAAVALAAGVDEAADADAVADLVLADVGADLGDDAGDLVADDDRPAGVAPLAARGVDVGVADAGELDVDQDLGRRRRRGARWWWARAARWRSARRRRARSAWGLLGLDRRPGAGPAGARSAAPGPRDGGADARPWAELTARRGERGAPILRGPPTPAPGTPNAGAGPASPAVLPRRVAPGGVPGPGLSPGWSCGRRSPVAGQYQVIGFTMPPFSHTMRCRWQPVE